MEYFKLWQMGLAYSQSLLSFKTNGSPRPFSASFAVSNRCNIQCAYCNFPLLNEPELSLTQIETLFQKLKKTGVKRLGLLGGEPLFRQDILEIIALAKKQDFFVSLNTNLLLYEKFKNKLGAIDFFFTSLDGTPEKHLQNRGKQSFEKILNAIRHIRSAGKSLTAICVVTDYDQRDAEYLIELAQKENFMLHFQPECYDTEIVQRSAEKDFNQQKARDFWMYLLAKKKEGSPISSSENYFRYLSTWQDYRHSSVYDAHEQCAAGRGYLFVDASGTAYPCAYTKGKTQGVNLLQDDWEEAFSKKTPCTKCIVGPMLEFNLMFEKPFTSSLNVLQSI